MTSRQGRQAIAATAAMGVAVALALPTAAFAQSATQGKETATTTSSGTTHYVSSAHGDDANAGTSENAPWKSLTKVNDIASDLGPGDSVLLELLQVLSEADSLATGPGVWGDWKAALIGDLVRRCRGVIGGEDHIQPEPIDPEHLSLAGDGGVHVVLKPGDVPHTYQVTMTAPDRRGLLSRAAGVLALIGSATAMIAARRPPMAA